MSDSESIHASMFSLILEKIEKLAIALGVVVGPLCFLSYFGANNDFFDLLSHFRLQFALCFVLIALVLVRRKIYALAFFLMAVSAAPDLPPFFLKEKVMQASSTSSRLRILQMNLWSKHEQFERIRALIENSNADLVALEEVSPEAKIWMAANMQTKYPYQILHTRPDFFGIGLLSRYPLKNSKLFYSKIDQAQSPPMVTTEIEVDGCNIGVLVAHLLPPFGEYHFTMDKAMIQAISDFCKDYKDKIVVGDLNLSQHSSLYKKLLRDTALSDSARGFGWHPTYPSFTKCGIYIDQCLTGGNIVVLDRKNGPYFGSDHFPVVIDLALPHGTK